jgi:DNA-damage-inducible protein D
LAIRSNSPDAEPFIEWLTGEVLPSIRKTGRYGRALVDPTLQAIVDTVVRVDALQVEQRRLDGEQQRLKAELAETVDELGFARSEIEDVQGDVALLGARVDSVTQNTGWMAALGWAKLNGFRSDTATMSRLGRRATAILRQRGQEPAKEHNQRYGELNIYPTDVLQQAADEIGLS